MKRDHIHYMDGACLISALISGAEWVASKRLHLNEINVFPVPDGDTGNNLTMTLKAATDAVRGLGDASLGEVSEALSRAILIGARGNAGIILAQFIRGFAREVQGTEKLYPTGFAAALESSVRGAYEAMAEPTEGTVLTVIRESVAEVSRLVADGEDDFVPLLEAMHGAAAESLARTPELLPVLKEAGVVDAGGEGFVDLLEGALRLVRGEKVEPILDSVRSDAPGVALGVKERDLKYRYCTEFLLEGPRADAVDVKVKLAGMGGSLVVVGSLVLVRVHIHTNSPDAVFGAVAGSGDIFGRKIDDMREQHREFIRGAVETDARSRQRAGNEPAVVPSDGRRRSPRDRRRRRVRIVTDSSADLPEDVAADLGITVVPLTVNFEDANLRCGVDMNIGQFYEKLEGSRTLPTTSQPTPHDFLQTYEELSWSTRYILSIHLSSSMSGTTQSARTAASIVSGVDVEIVDSRVVSAPLGMTVIEAARAAERGADIAELKMLVSNLSVRARVFFTVADLDYLVRGGRIGLARALLGKMAGITPILTIEDGMVAPVAKARGDRAVLKALVELARPELDGGSGGMLGVLHARRPEAATAAGDVFNDAFGFDETHVFELGGIVGTHTGPGAWGVSYFRRKPAR
jgi:DegV family protein with EDD domain